MGRAKVNMELITKEKTRKTTYETRKKGIIKKAKELSLLCDVDTAVIIYPPDSNNPEIWPQNPEEINKTITSYKLAKKNENNKRSTYDLNDYFQDRKRKVEDDLVKARKRNREAIYSTWFDDLNGLSEGQLRQFAIGLENKEKIVSARLELKKRNFNLQTPFGFKLENNQLCNHCVGSYPCLDQVQTLNHNLISTDLGWFNDAPNVQMAFGFGLENNQPVANHNVGSYPGFDQVQALDRNLMRHNVEWFNDPQNAQMACGFELENDQPANHYVGSYPSLDQVQVLNYGLMSQDRGWFDDAPTILKTEVGGFGSPVFEGDGWFDAAPTGSFVPMKPELGGFGSPVFEGDVVYDNSKPCVFDQPVEQCGPTPEELALQDSHVNYDGIGDFVLDDDVYGLVN